MFLENDVHSKNKRLIEFSCGIIESLYVKYEDDVMMTSKIHHYISHQLPVILECIHETKEKNKVRLTEHQDEQEKFTQQFLSQFKYYYNTSNETYFEYAGPHYKTISEDNILHHIVSTISNESNPILMNWKHKTKVSLLKKIKEQPITKTIPESETIQTVLQQLYPTICGSKSEVKYFLTVIGDNILRKETSRVHFISPRAKYFLRALNKVCGDKLNVQCTLTFKYKYHEKHNESMCRILNVLPLIEQTAWCDHTIDFYGLDILCVACHYSNIYGNADDYLIDFSHDNEIQQNVFRLKNTKMEDFVSQFVEEYLIDKSDQVSPSSDSSLTGKQVQYLWKDFLETNNYPIGLYNFAAKKCLTDKVFPRQYDVKNDVFECISSSYLPVIQCFLTFWNETMVEDQNEYAELELDEIGLLFRNWQMYKSAAEQKKKKFYLKENKIIDILTYFHPELEIIKDKYIMNTRNIGWDKDIDIEVALSTLKEEKEPVVVNLYNAYKYYCDFHNKQCTRNVKTLLVSKSYFENYINFHYGSVLDEKCSFLKKRSRSITS